MSDHQYVLTLSCPDRPGIVAAVSAFLAQDGQNILDAQQFDDVETGRFFMRVVFDRREPRASALRLALPRSPSASDELADARPRRQQRVMLLVSNFDHCLVDLLYRWRIGELPMDLVAVVSNHPRETYRRNSISATCRSTTCRSRKQTKSEQESELWRADPGRPRPISSCSRATCRSCRTICRPSCRAAASTSTTRSCRASRAPSPITRRMSAA